MKFSVPKRTLTYASFSSSKKWTKVSSRSKTRQYSLLSDGSFSGKYGASGWGKFSLSSSSVKFVLFSWEIESRIILFTFSFINSLFFMRLFNISMNLELFGDFDKLKNIKKY